MSLLALGINHKTAPVAIREQVAFTPDQLQDALQQLKSAQLVQEAAILSTCNRTEVYCVLNGSDSHSLLQWFSAYHQIDVGELGKFSYLFEDESAVRHIMRVSCGLDSMVLGEPQILGQLKDAYASAQQARSLGTELNKLFQQTFAVAKQVRTETAIGENPVSVAYAAVSLAQHIFADLSRSHALLIGAGETIELVARHLRNAGVNSMTVANRTLTRAQALAQEFDAEAVLLADIPHQLERADIVIASTASQLPILGKGMVERALKVRKHRPIFMVDIAVPRDIEPQVGELDDVYLYSVDDLQEVIEENLKSREQAAREAEALIEQGAAEFTRYLRARGAVDLLRDYRGKAERIRDQELQQALRRLEKGEDPQQVLSYFAKGLTNKLIHSPTIQLKKAFEAGRMDLINAAQELFELGVTGDTEEPSR